MDELRLLHCQRGGGGDAAACLQNRVIVTHSAFDGRQVGEPQMDFHSALSTPPWIFLTLAYSHTVGATVCPEKRPSNKEPSETITHQNSNYLTRLPPSVSSAAHRSPGDSGPAAKTLS